MNTYTTMHLFFPRLKLRKRTMSTVICNADNGLNTRKNYILFTRQHLSDFHIDILNAALLQGAGDNTTIVYILVGELSDEDSM